MYYNRLLKRYCTFCLWSSCFSTDISPAITIGFDQTTYTVDEGVMVAVCTVVTSGTLERDAIVQLSSVNDEAVGEIVINAIYNCTVMYVV